VDAGGNVIPEIQGDLRRSRNENQERVSCQHKFCHHTVPSGIAQIIKRASYEDVGSAHLPAARQEPPHDPPSSSFRDLPRQRKTGAIEYIVGVVSEISLSL